MNRIFIGIVAVVVILLIIRWFWSRKNKLTDLANGTEEKDISSSDLANSSQSTNFAYSVWFYVNDWSYRYGETKTILVRNSGNVEGFNNKKRRRRRRRRRAAAAAAAAATAAANAAAVAAASRAATTVTSTSTTALPAAIVTDGEPCPHIFLDPIENNLEVVIYDYNNTYNRCRIENVPLQKWVNLIVSVYNQTLDLYIDGKLIKTCVLDGVPKLDASADVLITPDGGFSGWTSNIEYWDRALNPQEAQNVYQKGNGTNSLGGLFKYGIRIQLVDDDEVKGSLEI